MFDHLQVCNLGTWRDFETARTLAHRGDRRRRPRPGTRKTFNLLPGMTDDDGGFGRDSRVYFRATQGATYYVAAGTFDEVKWKARDVPHH